MRWHYKPYSWVEERLFCRRRQHWCCLFITSLEHIALSGPILMSFQRSAISKFFRMASKLALFSQGVNLIHTMHTTMEEKVLATDTLMKSENWSRFQTFASDFYNKWKPSLNFIGPEMCFDHRHALVLLESSSMSLVFIVISQHVSFHCDRTNVVQ